MRLECLRIAHLRFLEALELRPGPGLNCFVGPNGAGKTSVLEAAYLLSHARSFRAGSREALLQRGASRLHVYGAMSHARQVDQVDHVGLAREGGRWRARVNGEAAPLGDLVRACAVVCFEPGTHALIAGPAEERRRFLDWGVFHVEHDFLALWQRYRRALKQRNALMRAPRAPTPAELAPWEDELQASGEPIAHMRGHYASAVHAELVRVFRHLLPELGDVSLDYGRGWDDVRPLGDALRGNRDRDRLRGHTTQGIHRADWRLRFAQAPRREHLSRGQEKLCALGCMLAQAQLFARHNGEWPIVCLDDLASELDAPHQAAVVDLLREADAQVWVTGTHRPETISGHAARMFHVEHGHVRAAA
jgi:DNA replication and repair protein RecF